MNIKIVFLLISISLCSTLLAQSDTSKSNAGSATFTRVSRHQDYGLSVTKLILDMGEGVLINQKDITDDLFTVNGSGNSGKSVSKIKDISVTDNFGDVVESGRYITISLDFGIDADSSGSISYIVILNKDMGLYNEGAQFIQKGRTIRR